ncbi:Sensor histidine kinase LiaS [subsurface metagenome]
MRVLLFELKSLSFENEKLGNLLKKLAKSISTRSGIPIRVQIDEKYKHSPKAEIGFYRIAQEALNNVVKHSNATEASLLFESYSKHMKLLISDNGNGFNSNKITPENLGLIIMKERSKLIGASLDISSNPGRGTKISITYTR